MIRLFKLTAIAFFILFICACNKNDDTTNPNVNFAATLNGASETPPNQSAATGSSTGTFNTTTKILTVTTTYSGFTPIAGHIHVGHEGEAGPVVFPFTDLTSPIVLTTVALTTAQEADLMSNHYYVNLHSAAYPGGEIRGQLIKQ